MVLWRNKQLDFIQLNWFLQLKRFIVRQLFTVTLNLIIFYLIAMDTSNLLILDCNNNLNISRRSELGLSRKINQNPKQNCIFGTPDYIAPEVLLGKSISDPAIDWWSFGVLMYEFIVGVPPFNDQTPEKIFANILNGNIVYPEIGYGENMMSPEAYDLICKLLNPEPESRLKVSEIKSHKFFKSSGFSYIVKW